MQTEFLKGWSESDANMGAETAQVLSEAINNVVIEHLTKGGGQISATAIIAAGSAVMISLVNNVSFFASPKANAMTVEEVDGLLDEYNEMAKDYLRHRLGLMREPAAMDVANGETVQ